MEELENLLYFTLVTLFIGLVSCYITILIKKDTWLYKGFLAISYIFLGVAVGSTLAICLHTF